MKKKKVLLSWSSGKDSAWAFQVLRQQKDIEIAGIVTTLNGAFQRVAMHAVRKELLQMQAQALGLPLHSIDIPYPCSDEQYREIMRAFILQAKNDGVEYMAFGDLFLENVRQYREENLGGTGIEPLFPLWGKPTKQLALEMIQGGLRARITCVDPKKLPSEYAGREFDQAFLKDLPLGCDPCGENGEFHSFVYDGPFFKHSLLTEIAPASVERDGFIFMDVMPVAVA
ncbi:MAG: ATP-binding protein [Candidatus Omnitrophota bacterium]